MSGVTIDLNDILDKTGGDQTMVDRVEISMDELMKSGITPGSVECEVIVLLDVSWSMDDEFRDGSVKTMLDRSLAYARTLDPDGKVQVVTFGEHARRANTISLTNYQTWLRKNPPRMESYTYLGRGMNLAMEVAAEQAQQPLIAQLPQRRRESGFGARFRRSEPESSQPVAGRKPVKVIVLTDGGPNDGPDAEHIQLTSAFGPVFWSYIYISNQSGGQTFLKNMDKQSGRYVDNSNAAFFDGGINDITDRTFAQKVTKDFGPWMNFVQDRKNGLLTLV